MRFLQLPGPGKQLGLWLDGLDTLICGQLYHPSYPSLYSLRGTEPRDPVQWVHSLDTARYLRPEVLLPSHADWMEGRDSIFQVLTDYRYKLIYLAIYLSALHIIQK